MYGLKSERPFNSNLTPPLIQDNSIEEEMSLFQLSEFKNNCALSQNSLENMRVNQSSPSYVRWPFPPPIPHLFLLVQQFKHVFMSPLSPCLLPSWMHLHDHFW